jgi:hypothetical protein
LRAIRSSFPHLRTGDVTLVSTTDETCSNVQTAVKEAGFFLLSLRSNPLCCIVNDKIRLLP